MNYLKIYNQIIEHAKSVSRTGYLEKHHIVPKCLNGTNDPDNLVSLTAREHYICHWLLAKHYNIKKLWGAFAMLSVSSTKHQRINNGRQFERARIARTIASSGDGNGMYGKPSACKSHTEETKEKISLSKLGKKRTPFKRSPATEETKEKIRLAKLGVPTGRKGIKANKLECPHCRKIIGGEGNFSRYHGNNCKHLVDHK